MDFNLADLGITKDELLGRLVAKITDGIDDDTAFQSDLHRRIDKAIEAAVDAVADRTITPNIESYIKDHCLQRTNEWGEAKGEPLTFTEYLVERAEAYMLEPVDFDGQTKGERRRSGYGNFRDATTRLAYMIDKHLHYHIEKAMETVLGNANSTIAEGLKEAARTQIDKLRDKLSVEVKTR